MTPPKRIELPTGLPVGGVNAYLFTEPEAVLVDCGIKSEQSLATLRAALAEESLALSDLSRVIISHPHIDHCGLAGIIVEESRASIHILSASVPWLVDYRTMWAQRNGYYRDDLFVRWSLPGDITGPIVNYYHTIEKSVDNVAPERIEPFAASDRLSMGGLAWQVLHTPGHAASLTCFYQPDTRQFLSTDMLLPVTPTPIPEPPAEGQGRRTPSLPQFIESLKMVEALECDMVYPGHGEPFTDHRALIQRQRDRITARKAQCLAFIKQGMLSLGELVLAMYPHYPPAYRFAGLWMTLGYLDLLAAQGEITLAEQAGDEPKRLEIQVNT